MGGNVTDSTDEIILRMELELRRSRREREEQQRRQVAEKQRREAARLEAEKTAARLERMAVRRVEIEWELRETLSDRFGHLEGVVIDERALSVAIDRRLDKEFTED